MLRALGRCPQDGCGRGRAPSADQRLVDFDRTTVPAGGSATLTVVINPEDLALATADGSKKVYSGTGILVFSRGNGVECDRCRRAVNETDRRNRPSKCLLFWPDHDKLILVLRFCLFFGGRGDVNVSSYSDHCRSQQPQNSDPNAVRCVFCYRSVVVHSDSDLPIQYF